MIGILSDVSLEPSTLIKKRRSNKCYIMCVYVCLLSSNFENSFSVRGGKFQEYLRNKVGFQTESGVNLKVWSKKFIAMVRIGKKKKRKKIFVE